MFQTFYKWLLIVVAIITLIVILSQVGCTPQGHRTTALVNAYAEERTTQASDGGTTLTEVFHVVYQTCVENHDTKQIICTTEDRFPVSRFEYMAAKAKLNGGQ